MMRRRYLACLSTLCYISFVSQPLTALASSAISVPPEARDTAATAIAAAQNILYEEEAAVYRANAEQYAQKADIEAAEAELDFAEAEKLLAQYITKAEQAAIEAQTAAAQAGEAASYAAALQEKAGKAMAEAEAAYRSADAIAALLQAEQAAREQAALEQAQQAGTEHTAASAAKTIRQHTLEDTDELLKLEKYIKDLEKVQKDAELAMRRDVPMAEADTGIDRSKADAAYAHADRLGQIATAAGEKAEQAKRVADEKATFTEEAEYRAAEARQAVLDARLVVDDAQKWALQSRINATEAQKELDRLIYEMEHPQGLHFFSGKMNYYSWRNQKLDRNGYQFTQPIAFSYWQKDFSYGMYTRYIISENNSAGAGGRVNTVSDTTLALAKRNEKPKFIVDYNVSVNIPTGKAALSWSEQYARMNEDLVEVSQFGKGWQFTPGISVSRKIGKEDMWTIGMNYTFAGSYNPTSDISNDNISGGDEWRRFLVWQHIKQNWQFVAGLVNTATSPTKIANGDRYDTADQWEYRLTYNRKLPRNQNIMFYYWRDNQNMNDIMLFDTDNALAHYWGTMWSKPIDDNRVLRVTFDVMKTGGSRYAGMYNNYDEYVNGRTKYTVGLGLDVRINERSDFSIDLQGFKMNDGKSTSDSEQAPSTYKGFNILMRYLKSI